MVKGKLFKGTILAITGIATCPCHLPLVLPALATPLAGTALGAFVTENSVRLFVLATIHFVGLLVYVLGRWKRFDESPSTGKKTLNGDTSSNDADQAPGRQEELQAMAATA